MDFRDRQDLIIKINELEKEFPVHTWKILNIDVWPLVKCLIFFENFRKIGDNNNLSKPEKYRIFALFSRFLRYFNAKVFLFFLHPKEVKYIFSGAPSHRVLYKDKWYNRYFDPMMDYLKDKSVKSYIIEYKTLLPNLYSSKRIIAASRILPAFQIDNINIQQEFGDSLWENHDFRKKLLNLYPYSSDKFLQNIKQKISAVLKWKKLYTWFFSRSKPKYAIGLCYYNNAMHGMMLAARSMGICCVDMQHGTQGELHAMYNFDKSPEGGYNILPTEFWTWDRGSKNDLDKWGNKEYIVRVVGNPWLELLSPDEMELGVKKNLILLTLQPLSNPLEDYILYAIKATVNSYDWYIRMHPRMSDIDRNILEDRLRELSIFEDVNINDASSLPLPLLLRNASLHISKYSGCIAEAALMNVKNLILDEIGVRSYSDFMKNGLATAFLEKDAQGLKLMIDKHCKGNLVETNSFELNSYRNILDDI